MNDERNGLLKQRRLLREKCKEKDKEIERLQSIIKEVREYITSYESISIMQGLMKEYSNYDLDIKTMNEMIRRYMVVHDELLEILDKVGDEK